MASEIELIQAMSVLSIQPGDVLVVKAQGCISRDHGAAIEACIGALLPGVKLLVLADGLDIGVIRQDS